MEKERHMSVHQSCRLISQQASEYNNVHNTHTTLATAVASSCDGRVDSSRIIRHTITYCSLLVSSVLCVCLCIGQIYNLTSSTIVLDISKHRVPRTSIGSQALVGNVAHPKVGFDGGEEEAGKRQQHMEEGPHRHNDKKGYVLPQCQKGGERQRGQKVRNETKHHHWWTAVYPKANKLGEEADGEE